MYTSLGEDQLQTRFEEYREFIDHVRSGKLDLFALRKKDREKLEHLTRPGGPVSRGFVLVNPYVYLRQGPVNSRPHLFFLFLSAYPNCYFNLKEWITKKAVAYECSAYTTLGQYDFVLRIICTDNEFEAIKEDLSQNFSVVSPADFLPSGRLPDPAKPIVKEFWVKVNQPVCYDRYNFLESTQRSPDLTMDDRAKLNLLTDKTDFLSIDPKEKKAYEALKSKGIILGTRCIVDCHRMYDMLAFILSTSTQQDLEKLLNHKSLGKNIIDGYTVWSPDNSNLLLVCEFPGSSNPLARYNRWMDDYYREIGNPCNTLEADSTIQDRPDIWESTFQLRKTVKQYWSPSDGITLGNPVWLQDTKQELEVRLDTQALIHSGVIVGQSGQGKNNSCLQIINELGKKHIKVICISFKGRSSFDEDEARECHGKLLTHEQFIDILSLETLTKPKLVNTENGELGIEAARHCFFLLDEWNKNADGQQALSLVVILDEILNLTAPSKEKFIMDELKPRLNVCRQAGIGFIIVHQRLDEGWDAIWSGCKNILFHRTDMTKEYIAKRVPRIKELNGCDLEQLTPGRIMINGVDGKGNPLPPVIVAVPQLKK